MNWWIEQIEKIMSSLLLLLGLISIVALPIFAHLFFYDKIQNTDNEKILYFLSLIPGMVLICSASYFSPAQTSIKSVECGVVKRYITYKGRGHTTSERIAITMDQSGYIRYFRFDKRLVRLQVNQHICFELYDRFKNKGLSESLILGIISSKEFR